SFYSQPHAAPHAPHSFPTRRSSDLRSGHTSSRSVNGHSSTSAGSPSGASPAATGLSTQPPRSARRWMRLRVARLTYGCFSPTARSEEHTSELQSLTNLVCRLLLATN